MNIRESKMFDKLLQLRNEFGVIGIKAEFEAEGTRVEELLRLIELVFKSNLKFGLKIGGCEAVRDLIESKAFGCDYIIAPMVESAYGLSKFIQAKNRIYPSGSGEKTEFLFNMETISCFNARDDVFKLARGNIDGCVFGRVDFSGSLGSDREFINNEHLTNFVLKAAVQAKQNDLDFVVGGGVSRDALGVLRQVADIHLSRYETRKVIFGSSSLELPKIQKGLLLAVDFELNWLKNKRDAYSVIYKEDEKRIEMLSQRWEQIIQEQGLD